MYVVLHQPSSYLGGDIQYVQTYNIGLLNMPEAVYSNTDWLRIYPVLPSKLTFFFMAYSHIGCFIVY